MTGFPWETIIKVYRDKLRALALPKLNNYAYDFMSSLVNDYPISEREQEQSVFWIVRDFFESLLTDALQIQRNSSGSGQPKISEEQAVEAALQVWQHRIERGSVLLGFRSIDLKLHSA